MKTLKITDDCHCNLMQVKAELRHKNASTTINELVEEHRKRI
jgi:predicted CopG family antitoxin